MKTSPKVRYRELDVFKILRILGDSLGIYLFVKILSQWRKKEKEGGQKKLLQLKLKKKFNKRVCPNSRVGRIFSKCDKCVGLF